VQRVGEHGDPELLDLERIDLATGRLRASIARGGSSAWGANAARSNPSRTTAWGSVRASASPDSRRVRQRSPIAPGKLTRYGRFAATSTAWLAVAMK
jgi:hypothetical protein